ncbi:HNH endonuclease signature motif containing protein [Candidatus Microthrix parvicella]|uniref:HNH endonuclease signature motif containing protein n=1 Tax=Candidatus Neomicrothrix parvicella TaxID=41950 RepID=UPI0003614A1F|nr:HNH endonuclease signature motif containing protein [Candidatus Microthrix parvicella]
MLDVFDTTEAKDFSVYSAEVDARWHPDRGSSVPVSVLAGSVADAARLLVERGVGKAQPRQPLWGSVADVADVADDADDAESGTANPGVAAAAGTADAGSAGAAADGAAGAAADGAAAAAADGAGGGVDVADLMVAVEAIGLCRRFLASAEAQMIARLEDTNASLNQLGERTTSWLSRTQEVPGPQAAETTRVAAKLDSTFHRFAAALAAGEIDHSYCAALVRASNDRTETALVDLQDELLGRVTGRRFGSWRRELSAVCALLDTEGPEPAVEHDDKVFLSETLDGLVDLKGTFTGSTAEEIRQLVEAHTDRLYRQARRDTNLTPDLRVPTRAVLRARALLDLLRRGSSEQSTGGPVTHINLDIEAAPIPATNTNTTNPADRNAQHPAVGDPPPEVPAAEVPAAEVPAAGDPPPDDPAAEVPAAGDHRADDPAAGGTAAGGTAAGRGQAPTPNDRDVPTNGRNDEGNNNPANPADPLVVSQAPPGGETSRDWFRRILGQRGDVLAGTAKLADNNLWRLLCNPTIHTFVTTSAHEILQMGRAVRTATPAQQRALRVRDGGCVFPGCDTPIGWTQAHHTIHWSKGGPTNLDSMALLCTTHHDITHRHHWQMSPNHHPNGQPNGTFHWTTPSGQTLHSQRHSETIP